MIDVMADQILDVPRKSARKQAMATLATMMGTLVMSRIAGSGEFSDEILAAGREAALARAEATKPAARRRGRRRIRIDGLSTSSRRKPGPIRRGP